MTTVELVNTPAPGSVTAECVLGTSKMHTQQLPRAQCFHCSHHAVPHISDPRTWLITEALCPWPTSAHCPSPSPRIPHPTLCFCEFDISFHIQVTSCSICPSVTYFISMLSSRFIHAVQTVGCPSSLWLSNERERQTERERISLFLCPFIHPRHLGDPAARSPRQCRDGRMCRHRSENLVPPTLSVSLVYYLLLDSYCHPPGEVRPRSSPRLKHEGTEVQGGCDTLQGAGVSA